MRILGIIPARGGSKRVPRKNVRLIGGKPLVARSIELALAVPDLSRVVVTSDDDEVLAIAAGYGAAIPLLRPAAISGDHAPAIDYVRHALDVLEASGEAKFDATCILQPSSPLTRPEDVTKTIELFISSETQSAVSVMKVEHAIHPAKLKTFVGSRLVPYLEAENGRMAAHELPEVFVRNCAVYVTKRESIDAGTIVTDDCVGFVMSRELSIDINDELDFQFCEFLASRSAGAT